MLKRGTKFSRFTLLDRLAEGGTAEVYRGLEDRGHGIQRLVAIKLIHSALAGDETFRKIFQEEIKVSLGLNHPNVIQTFDFGEAPDKRPYIVFEYVHGRTLRAVLTRLSERKRSLPVEITVFIAEQAAKALQYAHGFEDALTGRVQTIIHRDLSPHNLMISFDGLPKLIDFGIAKVLQRGDRTDTGLVKGKPSYLSPEQVNGEPLDGRSDVFTLGIVMWEMLSGSRLFVAPSAGPVMDQIISKETEIEPPSTFNPSVPAELDRIVLKALAREKAERFASAGELQACLYKLVSQKNRDAYVAELGAFVGELFASEIVEEKQEFRALAESVEEETGSLLIDQSWLGPDPVAPTAPPEPRMIPLEETNTIIVLENHPSAKTKGPRLPSKRAPARPSTRLPVERAPGRIASYLKTAMFGLAFVGVTAGSFYLSTRSEPPKPAPAPVAIESAQPSPVASSPVQAPQKPAHAKGRDKKHHKASR